MLHSGLAYTLSRVYFGYLLLHILFFAGEEFRRRLRSSAPFHPFYTPSTSSLGVYVHVIHDVMISFPSRTRLKDRLRRRSLLPSLIVVHGSKCDCLTSRGLFIRDRLNVTTSYHAHEPGSPNQRNNSDRIRSISPPLQKSANRGTRSRGRLGVDISKCWITIKW